MDAAAVEAEDEDGIVTAATCGVEDLRERVVTGAAVAVVALPKPELERVRRFPVDDGATGPCHDHTNSKDITNAMNMRVGV